MSTSFPSSHSCAAFAIARVVYARHNSMLFNLSLSIAIKSIHTYTPLLIDYRGEDLYYKYKNSDTMLSRYASIDSLFVFISLPYGSCYRLFHLIGGLFGKCSIVFWYFVGIYSGVSNFVLDRHWPSDVLAGSIIGHIIATAILDIDTRNDLNQANANTDTNINMNRNTPSSIYRGNPNNKRDLSGLRIV